MVSATRTIARAEAADSVDPEPVPWFDSRVSGWIRSFSHNMHTQYYQENRGHNPSTDDWFNEWYNRLYLRKLFLPGDFVSTLRIDSAEDFGCIRTWVDRLFLTVYQNWRIIKLRHIGSYWTERDMNYEPTQFVNETVHIATNRTEITCTSCRGSGTVYCPPTQTCMSCGGSGRNGCHNCGGSGRIYFDRDTWGPAGFRTCLSCSGRRYHNCLSCNNGQVQCWRCRGTGRVTCPGCDGAGIVINALVTTKTFSHHRGVNFQVEGLGYNQFKNGLKPGHFDKLNGTLMCEESQSPVGPGAIRQRFTAFAFYVYSCHYGYKGKVVTLNQIYPSKYVSTSLPYSKKRIALAIALAAGFVAGMLALALIF